MADEEENENVTEDAPEGEDTEAEEESGEESEGDSDASDSDEGDDESDESDESDEEDDSDEDEEGSDSEEEDDSSDDSEGDNREVLEAKKPKKRRKKTGSKKRGPKTTAGQRLAAAKAAKAAKKAAARGKQAEMVEDEAMARAEKAAGWFTQNRSKLMGAALAALVAVGAFFAFDAYQRGEAGDASTLLWQATETLNAPIGDEPTAPTEDEQDSDEERYDTIGERADAALTPLNELLANYGSTDLAPWAHLLRGRALYQKGDHADAREAFSAALAGGAGSDIAPRAIEGIAFSYEAEENWDEAVSRFEELRSDDDDSLTILADYHLARIHIAREQEEEAKEKLQAVLNALREEDAPELPFVRDQAELRLMAIDSSLVQRSAPDQDEMRRLIEQLQQQQGGAGGAGGAGGG